MFEAPEPPPPSERRAYKRTVFSGPVLLDSEKQWAKGQAEDVSAGGMKLHSALNFPLGSLLDVYFEMNGFAIEARARVIRADGDTVSLQFEKHRRKSTPPRRYSFGPQAA